MFVINATKIQSGGTCLTVVPHVCGVCKKAFLQEKTLLEHLYSHDEEETAPTVDSSEQIIKENENREKTNSNNAEKEPVLEEAIEEIANPPVGDKYQQISDCNLIIIENDLESGKIMQNQSANKSPGEIENTIGKEDDINSHSCEMCEKAFASKIYLYKHIKRHSGYRKYQCDLCRRSFVLKENLVKHRSSHTVKKVYYCLECNKTFPSSAHKKMHEIVEGGKKTNVCPICDRAFAVKANLERHMLLHSKDAYKFTCKMCGKNFLSDSNLQKHLKVKGDHSKKSPKEQPSDISITVVKKPFKRKGLHDKKPLYKVNLKKNSHFCKVCGEGFTSKKTMMKHRRITHIKGDYFCGLCNKGFTNRKNLQKHFQKHTGGRMFGCEVDS